EEAVAYARETESLLNEALGNELFARFWYNRGQPAFAKQFLDEAVKSYERWGAHAKVQNLEQKYSEALKLQLLTTREPRVSPGIAEEAESVSLDLSTVLKAWRALAAEIDLEALLRTLMQIALENAGAQRGVFVQDKDGRLVIEAEITAAGEMTVQKSIPLEQRTSVAQAVV